MIDYVTYSHIIITLSLLRQIILSFDENLSFNNFFKSELFSALIYIIAIHIGCNMLGDKFHYYNVLVTLISSLILHSFYIIRFGRMRKFRLLDLHLYVFLIYTMLTLTEI